jgi:hypothetical protein
MGFKRSWVQIPPARGLFRRQNNTGPIFRYLPLLRYRLNASGMERVSQPIVKGRNDNTHMPRLQKKLLILHGRLCVARARTSEAIIYDEAVPGDPFASGRCAGYAHFATGATNPDESLPSSTLSSKTG